MVLLKFVLWSEKEKQQQILRLIFPVTKLLWNKDKILTTYHDVPFQKLGWLYGDKDPVLVFWANIAWDKQERRLLSNSVIEWTEYSFRK